jgi:multiple sugar transport system permease protein
MRDSKLLHIVLCAAALMVLVPVVWIVLSGFRTNISLMTGILGALTLANFEQVLFAPTSNFIANYGNSVVVALSSTLICLAVATLAAWSLYRMRWPRWVPHLLLGWTLFFHMLPSISFAGGWYSMFAALGLVNTTAGLILAHTTLNLPMALWLMGVFIQDVPREVEEAAQIDGASAPVFLTQIVLPIITPGLSATSILIFIFSWNEFTLSLNLTSGATATVPIAIAGYASDAATLYAQMAAAAGLSILPALLLLLFGQRYIVSGLTTGAVK